MQGKRLFMKVLNPGESFVFEFCAIREFAITPSNGQEDFSYDFTVYGQTVRFVNVLLEDGGLNNYIKSCPDEPTGAIEIKSVTGQLVVFHKN